MSESITEFETLAHQACSTTTVLLQKAVSEVEKVLGNSVGSGERTELAMVFMQVAADIAKTSVERKLLDSAAQKFIDAIMGVADAIHDLADSIRRHE